MKKVSLWAVALAFVGFMGVACQNQESNDVEDGMEEMGEDMEDAADDAGDAIEEGVDETGDAMEEGAEEVEETMEGDGGAH